MGDSEFIKCVVCADNATPRVVKDSGYNAMMCLFWEAMNVDVKYTENIKFDLCPHCFHQILQFYDLNDACVIMEKRIHCLTRKIINKVIGGLEKLEKDDLPTLEVHDKIVKKYGRKPIAENADDNGIKFEYEFECRLLDTVIESKVSPKNKLVGDARKTVFSFNTPSASSKVSKQLEEGDSGTTNTPKASSSQRVVKAGKTLKGRGRGSGRKPKKGRRNTRLEKEEEDVYSDSEEDDNSTDDIPSPRKPSARKAKKSESSDSIGEDQMEEQEVAEEDKDGLDEKSEISVGSRSSGKSRLHCDICFTVVLNAKAYESHIKRHTVTAGAGFQCRICRQAYENKEDFMRHKAKHDDGTFLCPVCKAGFEVESKIIQHVQTAHKDFWNRQPQKLLPVGSD